MPNNSGDTNATMAILASTMQNLLKSNFLSKPPLFTNSTVNINEHLQIVDKFCKCINASSDLDKFLVLWDTIDEQTQKEVIFDSDYDNNNENFGWLCKKLKEIFPLRSSKSSDLMQLNQLRQNGRSLRDFASAIKQECAKRKANFSSAEIQSIAIKVFISGLENELFRRTLKQLNPPNINEALDAIKNLKEEDEHMVRGLNDNEKHCSDCDLKIKVLVDKIDHLHNLVATLQRSIAGLSYNRPMQKNLYSQLPTNSKNYSPRQSGNRPPPRCFKCNKIGHVQRFCRNQSNKFRHMDYVENDSYIDEHQGLDRQSVRSNFGSNEDGAQILALNEDEKLSTTVINFPTMQRKVKKYERHSLHTTKYPDDIVKMERFINGEKLSKQERNGIFQARPMTVITTSNDEVARNKPIVEGLVNDQKAKIFLDSGANVNVVDKDFAVGSLGLKKSDIFNTSSFISCANGSKLSIYGRCNLDVQVGSSKRSVPFIIADKLFPSVILGIVGMKDMSISLCPKRSCAYANSVLVPFLSKVDDAAKNGKELYTRTAIKLQL